MTSTTGVLRTFGPTEQKRASNRFGQESVRHYPSGYSLNDADNLLHYLFGEIPPDPIQLLSFRKGALMIGRHPEGIVSATHLFLQNAHEENLIKSPVNLNRILGHQAPATNHIWRLEREATKRSQNEPQIWHLIRCFQPEFWCRFYKTLPFQLKEQFLARLTEEMLPRLQREIAGKAEQRLNLKELISACNTRLFEVRDINFDFFRVLGGTSRRKALGILKNELLRPDSRVIDVQHLRMWTEAYLDFFLLQP